MVSTLLVLVFVTIKLPASYSVMLGNIPEYTEEVPVWCGPAVAQMIMNGYPSGALFVSQEDIWDAIQTYKVETMWHSDPRGLANAMQSLNPPPAINPQYPYSQIFDGWCVTSSTDGLSLMKVIAYWMTKNNYPVAVLLSTLPHNSIQIHQEHWVEVRGIVTDVNPTENPNFNIEWVWYTDPSPATLGDPPVISLIKMGAWLNLFQLVDKEGSEFDNQFVAIIKRQVTWPPDTILEAYPDPTLNKGNAQTPKEVLSGETLLPNDILKYTQKWIEKYKLYETEAYKDLKSATHLKPLLVDKKYGGYYLIPYTTSQGKGNNAASLAILINAYEGNFQQIGVFEPTKYLSEQEATEIALNYLKIKTTKAIIAELVTQTEGHYFGRFFPAWKITIDDKVVHVTQKGKIIS